MLDKMLVNIVYMIGMKIYWGGDKMKTNDFISNAKEKSKPIIVAVFLGFICTLILLMVGSIQIFFKMNSLGTFLSAITLLVLFMLVGKVIFNVNYNELFTEIKLSKDDCMNKLLYSIFFFVFMQLFVCSYIKLTLRLILTKHY